MRVFRHTFTALVLSLSFSGAALAADPAPEVAAQTDALMISTSEATRQSLKMDVDFDVMTASHQIETDGSESELVADASAAPVASPVDDNDA